MKMEATKTYGDREMSCRACEAGTFTVSITDCIKGKTRVKDYTVTPMPTDWDGKAFRVDAVAGKSSYNCFIGEDGEYDQCDCAAFTYNATRPCKHIEAIRLYVANPTDMAAESAMVEADDLAAYLKKNHAAPVTEDEMPECFRNPPFVSGYRMEDVPF